MQVDLAQFFCSACSRRREASLLRKVGLRQYGMPRIRVLMRLVPFHGSNKRNKRDLRKSKIIFRAV